MATRSLCLLAANSSRLLVRNAASRQELPSRISARTFTTNDSGALLQKPAQVRFGLIKVTLIATPFMYVGAMISREFAAWLEEHELFVPSDDDDDD